MPWSHPAAPTGRRRTESGWSRNKRRGPRPARPAAHSYCGSSVMFGTEIGLDHGLVPADRLRRAGCENTTVAEHDDLGRDLEHDIHVVLDEHHRDLLRLPELPHLVDH